MYITLCHDTLSDFIFLIEEEMEKFYFFYDTLIKVEEILDEFNLSSTGIFFLFPSQFFLRKKLPLPQAAEKGIFKERRKMKMMLKLYFGSWANGDLHLVTRSSVSSDVFVERSFSLEVLGTWMPSGLVTTLN